MNKQFGNIKTNELATTNELAIRMHWQYYNTFEYTLDLIAGAILPELCLDSTCPIFCVCPWMTYIYSLKLGRTK